MNEFNWPQSFATVGVAWSIPLSVWAYAWFRTEMKRLDTEMKRLDTEMKRLDIKCREMRSEESCGVRNED